MSGLIEHPWDTTAARLAPGAQTVADAMRLEAEEHARAYLRCQRRAERYEEEAARREQDAEIQREAAGEHLHWLEETLGQDKAEWLIARAGA